MEENILTTQSIEWNNSLQNKILETILQVFFISF